MRILYFHQYFATRGRSVPTRSYELARRLVERGHAVTIVSRDTRHLEAGREGRRRRLPVGRETVDGIDVVYLDVPYSKTFSMPLRLLSFGAFTLAATLAGPLLPRPDVVFASSTPLTIGIPGLVTARLRGVPFVFEIRDLWPEAPVELGTIRFTPLIIAAQWLAATLYRSAHSVVVLSEGSRDALVGQGVPPEKLVFIPNASDLDLFGPDVVDPDFRAAHGLEGKFVALYAGAIGRINGVGQLVDAAAALRSAGRDDIALLAVGDGMYRERLESRSRALGLDNLQFLGSVPKREMAGIVGAADVTLTLNAADPILQTTSPNKFFDSLAAGRAVVVNVDGWLRRTVEDACAGVYVPADDGDALAATLAALADEPALVARMGANARALAEREFDRDALAARLAETLEGAVGAGVTV